jgi:crossover junction endodeoxyribonuclease RusA
MIESSKHLRPWRALVSGEAAEAMNGLRPLAGPLNISLTFRFPRPKKHYRTGRHAHELRPDAPTFHAIAPDTDKLCRSIFDSLKDAAAILDDGQIASVHAWKVYAREGETPGVDVVVEMLDAIVGEISR